MERKLAAIFSTDVKGYSRLMGDDEEATIHTLKTYREVISGLIEQHHGRVVDSPGDNMLAEFASAVDAVKSAVAIQQELKTRNAELEDHRKMEFRIGLNVGDVITDEERLYGDGVNIAARVESLADPGGICISESVHTQVRNKLAFAYEYIGEREVKNIAAPVPVYRIHPKGYETAAAARLRETRPGLLLPTRLTLRWWAASLTVVVPLAFLTWWLMTGGNRSESPVALSPTAPSASSRKLIAVLPFENLGAPEQEYFAAGMTEEITSRLASVQGLGVTSRTTALQYKQVEKTVRQIGVELGVGYILEGTVRWAHASDGTSRVRITPQLVRVADDTHVWANSYEREISDIFAVQSEIAENVLAQLGVTLLESTRRADQSRGTQNTEAYDAYLRGGEYYMQALEQYSEGPARIAIQFFTTAVKLDPNFALAYAKLAAAHEYLLFFDRTDQRLQRVKEFAQQALDAAPELPEGHLALGRYFRARFETDLALREYELARRGRPGDSTIVHAIAFLHLVAGRAEDAIVSYQQTIELDPRRAVLHCQLGGSYRLQGAFPQAESAHYRAIELRPDRSCAYFCLAFIYLHWQGPERMRTFLESVPETVRREELNPTDYAWVVLNLIEGQYEAALQRVQFGAREVYRGGYFYYPKALVKAQVYALMGQDEQARQAYDQARMHIEATLEKRAGDPLLHSALGLAYAGLGRKADALREGRRAVAHYPEGAEFFAFPYRLKDLAQIYVMLGHQEAALDTLELLFSIPSWLYLPEIQLDPTWAPLLDHPRFQQLQNYTQTVALQ